MGIRSTAIPAMTLSQRRLLFKVSRSPGAQCVNHDTRIADSGCGVSRGENEGMRASQYSPHGLEMAGKTRQLRGLLLGWNDEGGTGDRICLVDEPRGPDRPNPGIGGLLPV